MDEFDGPNYFGTHPNNHFVADMSPQKILINCLVSSLFCCLPTMVFHQIIHSFPKSITSFACEIIVFGTHSIELWIFSVALSEVQNRPRGGQEEDFPSHSVVHRVVRSESLGDRNFRVAKHQRY